MKKNGNRKQLPFTLIELVIVIAILGALVALILPAFSTTEKDAKETSDAYNSRGVVRLHCWFKFHCKTSKACSLFCCNHKISFIAHM